MKNICLKISYLGTNYSGFQKQKNSLTIQESIENCFFKLFNREINLIGCSRTDSGVHAYEYYCNFHVENFNVNHLNIMKALNSFLPYDIRILDCYYCQNDFHSRYDAKMKEYEYRIFNGEVISPFIYANHFHFKYYLDFCKMKEACKYFEGEHDFKGFMTKGSSVKNTVRTIYKSTLEKENEIIVYRILGNGFLYNMVRIIVGTLIMVGQNKINANDIPFIINSGERNKSGFVSESKGLSLKKVFY